MADEIFFMVPSILSIHERFLDELKKRLDNWEPLQRISEVYIDVVSFSKNFLSFLLKFLLFLVLKTDSIGILHSIRKQLEQGKGRHSNDQNDETSLCEIPRFDGT